MKFLLDVNVLVAWGWADHADHDRAAAWIGRMMKDGAVIMTSAIPQLGFVRVSAQRSRGQISPVEAGGILAGMIQTLGRKHEFLPDDQSSLTWPPWCGKPEQTTDAHLRQLAEKHRARLATLDEGIPGAYLIPRMTDRKP